MASPRPAWELILEAAKRLEAVEEGPFKLEQLIEFVQRRDPTRGRGSISPVVQGMTVNATGGPRSPCGTVLRRTRPGFYELLAPGPAETRARKTSGQDPLHLVSTSPKGAGADHDAVVDEQPLALPPGDSAVQRAAEGEILRLAAVKLGIALRPQRLILADGVRIEVDGVAADRSILCEVWAHQGPAKVGQGHKVLSDAVKLYAAAQSVRPAPRLLLIVSDEAAVHRFRGKSWYGHALRTLGVEIMTVPIPVELQARIKHAQSTQYR